MSGTCESSIIEKVSSEFHSQFSQYLAHIVHSEIFLYFRNLDEEQLNRLMDYCLKNPNIIHMVKQISPWDIELEIMCENYEEYNLIISELTEKFSNIINKVETAIMSEDYVFPSDKMVFE